MAVEQLLCLFPFLSSRYMGRARHCPGGGVSAKGQRWPPGKARYSSGKPVIASSQEYVRRLVTRPGSFVR
jgi:hypothetical protein